MLRDSHLPQIDSGPNHHLSNQDEWLCPHTITWIACMQNLAAVVHKGALCRQPMKVSFDWWVESNPKHRQRALPLTCTGTPVQMGWVAVSPYTYIGCLHVHGWFTDYRPQHLCEWGLSSPPLYKTQQIYPRIQYQAEPSLTSQDCTQQSDNNEFKVYN